MTLPAHSRRQMRIEKRAPVRGAASAPTARAVITNSHRRVNIRTVILEVMFFARNTLSRPAPQRTIPRAACFAAEDRYRSDPERLRPRRPSANASRRAIEPRSGGPATIRKLLVSGKCYELLVGFDNGTTKTARFKFTK